MKAVLWAESRAAKKVERRDRKRAARKAVH